MLLLVALTLTSYVAGHTDERDVFARTESGWVRGLKRLGQNGAPYASFRGIPYAKQPLGILRFKELQPAEPWNDTLDATNEGPACYQHQVFFGSLMAPKVYSESCIFVNVHVPLEALPDPKKEIQVSGGRPIFVFYHGGGWIAGSGDSDLYGPEYLVAKGAIVVSFNYRLDVLGFLYLGTPEIPGNNGIRDGVTLLKWVKRNARRFGGDPDNITLSGQSAGSSNAHLISLAPVSKGLINRLWLMSGTALPRNHVTAAAYATQLATRYLTYLGLNGTDYKTVHDELVKMPIEKLYNTSGLLLPLRITTFMAVEESPLPGVTTMIADDPEKLLAKGYGDDIPVVVGYTNNECQAFNPRLIQIDIVDKLKQDSSVALTDQLLYTLPKNVTNVMVEKLVKKYFDGEPTLQEYTRLCTESYFAYPAMKFARDRKARGAKAPVYLYKFSYEADYSAVKAAININYTGAAHFEDMNNIVKVNQITVPYSTKDDNMKDWVSGLVMNFMKTGNPSPDNSWSAESRDGPLKYQEFTGPYRYQYTELSDEDQDMLQFYDNLASP